jgi:hypothetical protein
MYIQEKPELKLELIGKILRPSIHLSVSFATSRYQSCLGVVLSIGIIATA